jgi:serine/threonine protein kinase
MHHKNLVKFFSMKDNAVLNFADGSKRECVYVVYELVTQGSMLDFLLQRGTFRTDACKFYFKQLLLGLQYIHS